MRPRRRNDDTPPDRDQASRTSWPTWKGCSCVLVLEDIAYMLADLGCDTLTARPGTEALGTIANDQTIEILISDINMPGLAGADLAERARSYRPALTVILLTAGSGDNRGFPLLGKPFAQSDLQRVMAEATGLC